MDIWEAIYKGKEVLRKAGVTKSIELYEAQQLNDYTWYLAYVHRDSWHGYDEYKVWIDRNDEVIHIVL